MDTLWKAMTALAAVSAVWVPLIVWITKRLVEQKLSTDLESHKARLSDQNERLRSELALVVKEREIRFGALHAKRAGALVDLFTALDNAYGEASVTAMAATAGARPAHVELTELEAALPLYRANLLYVDTDLSKRIEAFFHDVREAATVEPSKAGAHADKLKAQRDAIEADFRVLLGSELSPPPPSLPVRVERR
jgi:hypothetical protein